MRILIVATYLRNMMPFIDQYENSNNGTTISARRFAEGLQKRGNTVTVLTTGKEGENNNVQ